jgi:hypothetical protein
MGASLISYILSLLCIALTVILPYVIKHRPKKTIVISIFSIVINVNYLFYAVTAGSLFEIISYGFGLLIVTWVLLFLLSEAVASLPRRNVARAEIESAASPGKMGF